MSVLNHDYSGEHFFTCKIVQGVAAVLSFNTCSLDVFQKI